MEPALRALTERVVELEKRLAKYEDHPSLPTNSSATSNASKTVPQIKSTSTATAKLLGETVSEEDKRLLAKIQNEWQAVLEEVKKQSVHTRAWLYAGTPEAVRQRQLITVFQSKLHAETVMNAPHREIIDNVLKAMYQVPIRLRAVHVQDWESYLNAAADSSERATSEREPWVERVINMFGEDRIEMVDETE